MKLRRVASETGIFSKLACVTITASQLPVAIRLNSRARLLASKSSFAGDENVRSRIEREQLGRELPEHVIRHDEHRLRREPEPLQFDAGRDHRVGLAGADDVREQRVVALHDAPDRVLLMRVQRDLLADSTAASDGCR